jgi:hypothetical protein
LPAEHVLADVVVVAVVVDVAVVVAVEVEEVEDLVVVVGCAMSGTRISPPMPLQ